MQEKNKQYAELKKKIEDAYFEYRTDQSFDKSLEKVAGYFAIPYDSSRPQDYYVRGFSQEPLVISIVDKATDTVHKGHYSFLDTKEPIGNRLQTTSTKANVSTEKFYRVDAKAEKLYPIKSTLSISHEGHTLSFERSDCVVDERPFRISLNLDELDENLVLQRRSLFTKILPSRNNRVRGGIRELTFPSFDTCDSWQRHNTIKGDKKLCYSIDYESPSIHMWGRICDDHKCDPAQTLIHFTAFSGQESYYLNIFKINDKIKISYSVGNLADSIFLSSQSTTLSIGEINSIVEALEGLTSQLPDEEFIRLVIIKLEEYARRLLIHRGFEEAPEDVLSPELFASKSFEEIEAIIMGDIDAYFEYALRKYEASKGRLAGNFEKSSLTMKPVAGQNYTDSHPSSI